MKITPEELNERLKWPVDDKVCHCVSTFVEFYVKMEGNVYLGFSGGKDSQTLDYIIEGIFAGRWKHEVIMTLIETLSLETQEEWDAAYQEIILDKKWGLPERVFCDTGLEFPEIRKHVKTYKDVVWMRPLMKFPDVIKNVGVAVGSKKIAMQIRRLKDYMLNPSKENEATRTLMLTGIRKDGQKSNHYGLSEKWKKLLTAPFNVSDKCCDIFKKEPWRRYVAQTGRKPISGTTVVESMQRRSAYLSTGCNTFDKGKEMSRPLSIFTERDIWEFAEKEGIRFCEVYYDRVVTLPDGNGGSIEVFVEGENRTGCMFCLFGIHLESKKKPNRFQRLAVTHPKQYEFMINSCGLGTVLDFINVGYKITPELFKQGKLQNAF